MKAKTIIASLFLLAVSVACKEAQLGTYSGENYVHFFPDGNDAVKADYNFAEMGTTREETAEIPLKVRLWGFLPEADFEIVAEVVETGTTARPSDYENTSAQIFRKGAAESQYLLKVHRRPELLSTDYVIKLKLVSAQGHVVAPSSYTTATVTVKDDLSGKMPLWWNTTTDLGPYSEIKLRLFNYYLGFFLENLDNYTAITFKQEALKFKTWLKEKFDDGNFVYYDSDGVTPLYQTIPD